jgi:carbonyl reductase 1
MVPYAVFRSCAASLGTNLKAVNKVFDVRYDKLSLTDQASMTELTSRIKEHGGYDMLSNNADVYHYADDITAAQRKETMNVNYRGTLRRTHGL